MNLSNMKWGSLAACALTTVLAQQAIASGGTWQPLAKAPGASIATCMLMQDGTVLAHEYNGKRCYKLTPDSTGSYVNGTWTQLASMKNTRLYYASQVLLDGRCLYSGGEYSDGGSWTTATEYYNPLTNTWTSISGPPGWSNVGDAISVLMSDGRFYIGATFDNRTAFWNPTTNTWTAGPTNLNSQSDEANWAPLWDGTLLMEDCFGHPGAEKYNPDTNKWFKIGNVPIDLVDASSLEIGPSMVLPDGRCLTIGATPHSAIYTTGANRADQGTWAIGPDPIKVNNQIMVMKDAPACTLPNGNILCAMGTSSWVAPTYMEEYDLNTNTFVRVSDPSNNNAVAYNTRMLMLPTGQVLYSNSTSALTVYTPNGSANPAWKPEITSYPTSVQQGNDYPLQGKQLTGYNLGAVYGDDAQMSTNYPIVRLTNKNTGAVTYCRTHDHSTSAIGTGAQIVSTNFAVPSSLANGVYSLTVITNGIPSDSFDVSVGQNSSTVLADSYTVGPQGKELTNHNVALILKDDSEYAIAENTQVANANIPAIRFDINFTSPFLSASAVSFQVNAQTQWSNIEQRIEFALLAGGLSPIQDTFVYTTPATDVTRTATTTDSSLISNILDGSNGHITAVVRYRRVGVIPSFKFQGRIDYAQLTVTQ